MLKFKGKEGYELKGNKGQRRWRKQGEGVNPIPLSDGSKLKVHVIQGKLITPMRMELSGREEDRQDHGIPEGQGINHAKVIVTPNGKKYYVKQLWNPIPEIGDSHFASELGIPAIKSYRLSPEDRFDTLDKVASELVNGFHPYEMPGLASSGILGLVPRTKEEQEDVMGRYALLKGKYDPAKALRAAGGIAYFDALTQNLDGFALHRQSPANIILVNGIPHAMDFDGSTSPLNSQKEWSDKIEQIMDAEDAQSRVEDAYHKINKELEDNEANDYWKVGNDYMGDLVRQGFTDAHKAMLAKNIDEFTRRFHAHALEPLHESDILPRPRHGDRINPYLQEHLAKVRF